MMDVTIEVVVGKLNRVGHNAFAQAMRQAKSSGHANVELAHWLSHLLQRDKSDLSLTLDHFQIDRGRVLTDIQTVIAGFKENQTEIPTVAETVSEALDGAWHYATLMFGEPQIRSGHVLVALLKSSRLRRALAGLSQSLRPLSADAVVAAHRSIWRDSDEEKLGPIDGSGLASPAAGEPAAAADRPRGDTPLARFAKDMTAEAASGKMDAIVGRDMEIRQIIDVLMRRRQNNPILTGEAGVGKTAVVEGFAQAIVEGRVPDALKGVKLYALDVGLLQAGASMKGEFEQRLRSVIDEVQNSPTPIILFIDEAHTLVGAGGQAGTGDAANLLKPALARGTLRTVAATTWAEYRQYFEKDPALTRRFQPVQVDEPSIQQCCLMVRGVLGPMEKHHNVRISDEAVVAAVSLSKRYIPARQLPDKAVSLLDTAAARVAISQATRPAALADTDAALTALQREEAALIKDADLGVSADERLAEIASEQDTLRAKKEALEAEWAAEQAIVQNILSLRRQKEAAAEGTDVALDGGAAADGERVADPASELAKALDALAAIDAEKRRVYAHVDEQAVAAVVSDWTGIPVGRMVRDEIETVLNLTDHLAKRVIGQDHGLRMIAKRVETSRAKLDNPNKPIGVFMLCGPSGVGKTETALAVAEALYGGEQNVITINMSEYQEAHTVSSLKGAPPGYVGYGEGGKLTEAVRRKPYSVVLLDEVEKAHPDVHEVFFQVFDKGMMEDGTGRLIDFKNTLIMLTSNVGTELIDGLSRDPYYRENPEELSAQLRPELLKVFPAALLGRMVTIPYYPLSNDVLGGIVRLKLNAVARLVRDNQNATLTYEDSVIDHIVAQCNDPSSGGRMVDAIVTNTLLPTISREFLTHVVKGETLKRVAVGVRGGAFVFAFNDETLPEPDPVAEPAAGATDAPAPAPSAPDAANPQDAQPGADRAAE